MTAIETVHDLVARHGLDGAAKLVRGKLNRLRRQEAADSPNREHWGAVLRLIVDEQVRNLG